MAVDLLDPITFAGLLVGAMLPYWFSAMTMKSVGMAADSMVKEIKRQFDDNPNLKVPGHPDRPNYDACITISTDASLSEMILPGLLVMLSPIVCGVGFGTKCVTGLLAGGIASGVQMAISSSNTGGAWDNAKKYISGHGMDGTIAKEEPGLVKGGKYGPGLPGKVDVKKSQIFKAAVVGDTVGDPLKDTSGPALNILMKLMSIISVVFAPVFMAVKNGGGLIAYLLPEPSLAAITTNLAVGVQVSGSNTASNVFVASVFLAGAVVGMGGLFIHTRIQSPPRSVMRESLKSPLLACKVEHVHTELRETYNARPVYTAPNMA